MRFKTRTRRHLITILVCACIFLSAEISAARDVAVVTNKNSRVQAMKSADLMKMIKSAHKGLDAEELTVVLTDPSSPEMRIIAAKLLLLTIDDFRKLIDATNNKTRATFLVVSSDEEVLKTVESNPSAIGLVNVYSINSNVGVLKIDGKLPLESGYILHGQ